MVVMRARNADMEISLESQGTLVIDVQAAANMGIKRIPGFSTRNWVVI